VVRRARRRPQVETKPRQDRLVGRADAGDLMRVGYLPKSGCRRACGSCGTWSGGAVG
jgi:hypothetical protein